MGMQKNLEEHGATGEFSISKIRACLNVIEKSLSAFEIVKTKQVAVDEFIRCCENAKDPLEEYNAFAGDENALTQHEFDLLKDELLRK